MARCSIAYDSERELVDHFTRALADAEAMWGGAVDFAEEFYYLRGRTDVVAITVAGAVIAFEAKLQDWREALHQAYRNTCFAHESYVVLPSCIADRALRSDAEFTRRGVGLCTMDGNALKIIHPARKTEPMQKWLSQRAAAHVSGDTASDC